MLVGNEWVERREVPKFFNEEFWSAYRIYSRFRRFGFPYSGGWEEQPAHIVELIEAMDQARDIAVREADEWEKLTKSK